VRDALLGVVCLAAFFRVVVAFERLGRRSLERDTFDDSRMTLGWIGGKGGGWHFNRKPEGAARWR
jgi:hypothetical protein